MQENCFIVLLFLIRRGKKILYVTCSIQVMRKCEINELLIRVIRKLENSKLFYQE
jgi:hypothetical protein